MPRARLGHGVAVEAASQASVWKPPFLVNYHVLLLGAHSHAQFRVYTRSTDNEMLLELECCVQVRESQTVSVCIWPSLLPFEIQQAVDHQPHMQKLE